MDKEELIQTIYTTCRKGYSSVLHHLLSQLPILSIEEYQGMIEGCLYFKTSIYDYPDGTTDYDVDEINYGKVPGRSKCLNIIIKKYQKAPTTFFKIMFQHFYLPIPIIQQILFYSYPSLHYFLEQHDFKNFIRYNKYNLPPPIFKFLIKNNKHRDEYILDYLENNYNCIEDINVIQSLLEIDKTQTPSKIVHEKLIFSGEWRYGGIIDDIIEDKYETVTTLVNMKIDINIQNSQDKNNTLLHILQKNCDEYGFLYSEQTIKLLELKADINILNDDELSPLNVILNNTLTGLEKYKLDDVPDVYLQNVANLINSFDVKINKKTLCDLKKIVSYDFEEFNGKEELTKIILEAEQNHHSF